MLPKSDIDKRLDEANKIKNFVIKFSSFRFFDDRTIYIFFLNEKKLIYIKSTHLGLPFAFCAAFIYSM